MAEGSAKWVGVLSDCLTALEREQIGSSSPVVDHEIVPGAAGGAEDITVWLICRTRAERQAFRDSDMGRFNSELRKRLLRAGFPESAITSLVVRPTSREEVDRSGGRISSLH